MDDFSKFIWFFPLTLKSNVFAIFVKFQTLVENQFHTTIKSIQTDWGGEFQKLHTFFEYKGIQHRLPCPHTHEQNGPIE